MPRLGYGAMGLSGLYGAADGERAAESLRLAADLGMMIDTADAYGEGGNESLIAEVLGKIREKAFIATKFGIVFDENEPGAELPTGWGFSLKVNGSPDYFRRSLDASLRRLNRGSVDLYYAHFLSPATPVEETVGAMAEAVKAGKVRHLGLCNVNAGQLRRAHAVHPIAAVQCEYSLCRREPEAELLPALRELGVALVAWSPLGAGFLGGVGAVPEGDFRRNIPRFSEENLTENQSRFTALKEIAAELKITPAQLSLAWLLGRGEDIFAIPGTRNPARLRENAAAAEIKLDGEVAEKIGGMFPAGAVRGASLMVN